ncbi:MAG: 4Fe-4S dicluster domain-containing protein [Candidatus Omnitrophota bacterium]|nr:4Fe-4S dicluster domain-containing protein [Candidatus Omnitrophota bacterium]
MNKIITKEEFIEFLAVLSGDYQIIGPRELSNKGIFYQPIEDMKDLYWGEGFATEPIKHCFLSPSEYLFKGNPASGSKVLEEMPPEEGKRIIIGLRPCEARGLVLLDKVFDAQDYKDEFYLNNRRRSILVGLSCTKPDASCFCASLDGSPASSRGLDALLFPSGDEFIIEIISDAAQKIFGDKGRGMAPEETRFLESAKAKAKGLLKLKIRAPESMDAIFEDDYWRRVSRACLSCGVCTFLCPTCHCFDLVDEQRSRLRCYDGCAFSDFTMEASGVNPRPGKRERYRQRVYHKFDYFRKNFGENLCVGCGRCIRFCPVKINIAKIVNNAPMHSK